jgi:hypothetical protein
MYPKISIEPKVIIFLSIILEIDLDIQTVVPRIKEGPCQLFAWGSAGGRLA